MRKKLVWIAATVVTFVVAAAAALYVFIGRPLYDPGTVRAGVELAEPLEPPAARGADPAWLQVAEDVRLFTFSEGTGEEVLVVHGGPGLPPARPWSVSAVLADRYRFVYFQQRGCGRSSRPIERLSGDATWEDFKTLHRRLGLPAQIADIERVRRLLGRDRIVLLGHSFGALFAGLYAAEFPERVSALILVSPAPLFVMPAEGGDLFTRIGAALPPERSREFDAWRRELFDFRARLREPDDALAERYARFGRFYVAAGGSPPPPGDRPGGLMPYATFLGLGRSHDWRSALQRVTAPVLVVHGTQDLQSEEQTRSVAAAFPNSRFVAIQGAGHFAQEERPAALARAIREFLAAR